jgi:hypothetical protein
MERYVETQYRKWTLQQTWNDEAMQWDRVAVQGELRVEQGKMTYHQFVVAMDRLDGRDCCEDFLDRLTPEDAPKRPWNQGGVPCMNSAKPVVEPVQDPAAPAPASWVPQSLFGDEAFA